jgi:signal transduction histidine kinase
MVPSFILRWFADRQCDDERSRQTLSSYASHDLRSPMTTIREAVALLADGVPGKINDKQRRLLAIILERAETWLRLVDEVVVLPQWASDGSPLHFREESLPDVAYESVEKTKGLALLRGVTVTVKFPDSLPKIMVDRLRLGQALTILLAAVISSTEQGGQVRLSLKLVSETEMQVDVSSTNAKKLIEEGTALMAVRTVLHAHGGRFSINAVGTSDMTYELTLPLLVSAATKERFHVESAHH